MDEIKSNIEKIFDDYSDSIAHAIPKRLSFNIHESFNKSDCSSSKKRKRSLELNGSSDKRVKDEKLDISLSSNTPIVASSPWESRRMKADLLDAKSQIIQLKLEIEQQNNVRNELEILYKSKIDMLQSNLDHGTLKISDLEKHITTVRKRDHNSREELAKLKNELNASKQNYEEEIYLLKKENSELNENYKKEKFDMSSEISELQRHLLNAKQALKSKQDEFCTLNTLFFEVQEKSKKFEECEKELEAEKQKSTKLQSRVKELEYELGSHGEWKSLSKTVQSRLTSMSDLEKEVVRLRQEAKNWRDTVGNKLVLEEQVYDLKSRLENTDKYNVELATLKVQLATMEQELKNWQAVGADHCPSFTTVTPSALRNRLENILQNDLVLTNEKSGAKNEMKTLHEQYAEMKTQFEATQKTNNDLKIIVKRHQNIIQKLQKKLIIVAGERDCYKRLLDNYEKDLTITDAKSQNGPESQNRIRIEMLERTVNQYKEMCANLEKELQSSKTNPEINIDTIVNDNYEKLRKELSTLRAENEKVRRRKEELELELEHRCLKGDFNLEKFKVVHLASNPASTAYDLNKNEVEKLQVEVERLKRKIRKLEENEQEMTMRLNDTNLTVNIKEMNTLRSQVQSLESKNQHLKEIYKAASQEFRDVCYMLFGYRVDRVGNKMYRIASMYAESEEDYLNFRLNESGVLDMLESEYSISLTELMRTNLVTHNSLPAFLSALTMDLFNRITVDT